MAEIKDRSKGLYRLIWQCALLGERINSVSTNAELLFWRLNLVADDFGCFDASPLTCRHAAFPARTKLSVSKVGEWLKELQKHKLVQLYSVGGKPFGRILDWENMQPPPRNGKRVQRVPSDPSAIQIHPDPSRSIQTDPDSSKTPDTDTDTDTDTQSDTDTESQSQKRSASAPLGRERVAAQGSGAGAEREWAHQLKAEIQKILLKAGLNPHPNSFASLVPQFGKLARCEDREHIARQLIDRAAEVASDPSAKDHMALIQTTITAIKRGRGINHAGR